VEHPEKVFRRLESELRVYDPVGFSLLRALHRYYAENGKLCLEIPGNTLAALVLQSTNFTSFLRSFSERHGNEVFLKII
jgi:hypothetical protein